MNAKESREDQSLRILAYTSITKQIKNAGLITDKEEQRIMKYISGLKGNLVKPEQSTVHSRNQMITHE